MRGGHKQRAPTASHPRAAPTAGRPKLAPPGRAQLPTSRARARRGLRGLVGRMHAGPQDRATSGRPSAAPPTPPRASLAPTAVCAGRVAAAAGSAGLRAAGLSSCVGPGRSAGRRELARARAPVRCPRAARSAGSTAASPGAAGPSTAHSASAGSSGPRGAVCGPRPGSAPPRAAGCPATTPPSGTPTASSTSTGDNSLTTFRTALATDARGNFPVAHKHAKCVAPCLSPGPAPSAGPARFVALAARRGEAAHAE